MANNSTALNRTTSRALAGASFFRSTGWLSQTSPDFQDAILTTLQWKVAEPGEQISRAGDLHGGLLGTAEGVVEVSVEFGHPDTPFVDLAKAGLWVGYRPLLGKSRNITLTARTELLWALSPQSAVEALLDKTPVYWRDIALLGDMAYEVALGAVVDLTRHDGLLRLAASLLRLCNCRTKTPGPGTPLDVQISQSDLAGICVMSRNTVGAHLHNLVQQGLIELDYRHIRIVEPDKLRDLLRRYD